MARYVTRPTRAWWDEGAALDDRAVQPLGHPVVASASVDTGLLDRDGNRIVRVPDEVGFYRKDRERS